MSFHERDVEVQRVLALDPETAAAVGNDLRARILERLAAESGTIESLTAALAETGEARAEPTVRHHVRRLEAAGLVEVTRLEAVGGGTRKHYRATTRLLPYSLPEETEAAAELTEVEAAARRGTRALVNAVLDNHGETIDRVARELEDANANESENENENEEGERGAGTGDADAGDHDARVAFVVRELVDRALTDLERDGEFDGDRA